MKHTSNNLHLWTKKESIKAQLHKDLTWRFKDNPFTIFNYTTFIGQHSYLICQAKIPDKQLQVYIKLVMNWNTILYSSSNVIDYLPNKKMTIHQLMQEFEQFQADTSQQLYVDFTNYKLKTI